MTAPYRASRLVRPGIERRDGLVVLGPGDPERAVGFVSWLRDRASATVDVIWHGAIAPGIDVTLLHHLPPPVAGDQDPGPAAPAARWRAEHRPAMCYYRVGPGFIQVKDVRTPQTAARFVLDDPVLIDTFTGCLRPRRIDGLTAQQRAAARALLAERLLMRVGDWVTTLPSRMRRWPVPSQIV